VTAGGDQVAPRDEPGILEALDDRSGHRRHGDPTTAREHPAHGIAGDEHALEGSRARRAPEDVLLCRTLFFAFELVAGEPQ
jgi:hypothetical protein